MGWLDGRPRRSRLSGPGPRVPPQVSRHRPPRRRRELSDFERRSVSESDKWRKWNHVESREDVFIYNCPFKVWVQSNLHKFTYINSSWYENKTRTSQGLWPKNETKGTDCQITFSNSKIDPLSFLKKFFNLISTKFDFGLKPYLRPVCGTCRDINVCVGHALLVVSVSA